MIYLFFFSWIIMGFLTGSATVIALQKNYDYDRKWRVTFHFHKQIIMRVIAIYILWPYFAVSEDLAVRLFTEIKNSPFFERPNLN